MYGPIPMKIQFPGSVQIFIIDIFAINMFVNTTAIKIKFFVEHFIHDDREQLVTNQ